MTTPAPGTVAALTRRMKTIPTIATTDLDGVLGGISNGVRAAAVLGTYALTGEQVKPLQIDPSGSPSGVTRMAPGPKPIFPMALPGGGTAVLGK